MSRIYRLLTLQSKMAALSSQLCLYSVAKKNACTALSAVCVRHSSSGKDELNLITNTDLAALKRGTGGRSSFSGIVATVFGSTGFMGRYVVNKLGKIGSQVILPYRCDPYDIRHLKLAGDLGQVLFQPFHLQDVASIKKAIKYSNVVINLIGREWETKNFKFDDVHVAGARAIARACKEVGVERLIHVSALNATDKPDRYVMKKPSNFFSSKYNGELAVLEEFPNATIIRPSDIYGQEDRFLRYYAWVSRRQGRWLPVWRKGEETEKQPVYVSDVAAGIVSAAKDNSTKGQIYQAVGPKRYKLSELLDWFYRVMRRDNEWGYIRYDMKWDPFFKSKVKFIERISPNQPLQYLSMERLERECVSDKVIRNLPTLEDLGVNLTEMENQVPWELRPLRAFAYYDAELHEFSEPAPPKTISLSRTF